MSDNRVFFGPHNCIKCHKMIVKASFEQGGEEFDAPVGPVYPNTVWVRHSCVAGDTKDLSQDLRRSHGASPVGNPGLVPGSNPGPNSGLE